MAIFINYLNKSLQFYSKDSENSLNNKEFNSELENNEQNKTEVINETETIEGQDISEENENSEELTDESESAFEENSSKTLSLNFSESNMLKHKFENLDDASLEEFFVKFEKNEIELSKDLVENLKQEKQLLILPDELICFDFVKIPNLGYFRSKKSLNTKLSINYKDIEKLGKSIKVANKIKPNIIYSIQLARPEVAKKVNDYFTQKGVKIKGLNFYSGCLGNFYNLHIRGAKNASIVVKISETTTTILAIIHGIVVATTTLQCGERDVYKNTTYKFDEYSRRSISHKFVCYSASKIGADVDGKKSNEKPTREQIEKIYSKARLSPLAGNFQFKSINIIDHIKKKIDEMIMFIKSSEVSIGIDKIFIDVKNTETFEKMKLSNAVKVYFSEEEIFRASKPNEILKFNVISSLMSGGFSWSSLWKKLNKKA